MANPLGLVPMKNLLIDRFSRIGRHVTITNPLDEPLKVKRVERSHPGITLAMPDNNKDVDSVENVTLPPQSTTHLCVVKFQSAEAGVYREYVDVVFDKYRTHRIPVRAEVFESPIVVDSSLPVAFPLLTKRDEVSAVQLHISNYHFADIEITKARLAKPDPRIRVTILNKVLERQVGSDALILRMSQGITSMYLPAENTLIVSARSTTRKQLKFSLEIPLTSKVMLGMRYFVYTTPTQVCVCVRVCVLVSYCPCVRVHHPLTTHVHTRTPSIGSMLVDEADVVFSHSIPASPDMVALLSNACSELNAIVPALDTPFTTRDHGMLLGTCGQALGVNDGLLASVRNLYVCVCACDNFTSHMNLRTVRSTGHRAERGRHGRRRCVQPPRERDQAHEHTPADLYCDWGGVGRLSWVRGGVFAIGDQRRCRACSGPARLGRQGAL